MVLSFKSINLTCLALSLVYASCGDYTVAQIAPDDSLGNESSVVNPNVSIDGFPADQIEGGAKRGSNLFHSFEEFNIGNEQRAFFANPAGIENIFSRVTGSNPSNILGTLGVNGEANLFLLNPNGIIFGSNAQLDLNGSFFGSTANSIKFADDTEFSATNPADPNLLTINIPIGLQYGQNPGSILVQGQGNELVFNPETGEVLEISRTGGLEVQPGQTLALAGGEVRLDGGSLRAESGQVELWSIDGEGLLSLSPRDLSWSLSGEGIDNFQDISLSQAAAIDTSGMQGGSIKIQGKQVNLQDGSLILSITQGEGNGETVSIVASESIEAGGIGENSQPSGLLTETLGSGTAGNVNINTKRLILLDGAQISSSTFSQGNGGQITVNAWESVQMAGVDPNEMFFSGLFAVSFGSGNSGTIKIDTEKLTLETGAQVSAFTVNQGSGGNVIVNAAQSVELRGTQNTASGSFESGLSAFSFGRGNGGRVEVNTKKLSLLEGARISSTTFEPGTGDGGDVSIVASESVEVIGIGDLSNVSSGIFASNQNENGDGNAGNLSIETRELTLQDGGEVSVKNLGEGDAGSLSVIAGNFFLDNQARLLATTTSGQGGDINLQISDLMLLRRNSQISTTAGSNSGAGDGGNININADLIVAFPDENSDISANAFLGNGGRVEINTQALFGTEFRPEPTSESDITASSEFGLDGIVEIDTPDDSLSLSLTELPTGLAVPPPLQGCQANRNPGNSSFINTGRGGLPPNPYEPLDSNNMFVDVQLPSQWAENSASSSSASPPKTEPILEANNWVINEKGRVELVADRSSTISLCGDRSEHMDNN
ncbi:MAG: S-layer family protein [Pleurocapsa sp. MO_226.B13]|nr:S-layer family protein [Pleurocapsa sp. MO_226.B13]